MRIESVEPRHFGPFATGTVIRLEKDVTILTGPNDVGKSAVLKLLELICNGQNISQNRVNRERIFQFSGAWDQDPEVGAAMRVFVCEPFEKWLPPQYQRKQSASAIAKIVLSPRARTRHLTQVEQDGQVIANNTGHELAGTPSVIVMPPAYLIGNVIDIADPNPVERKFLEAAFGGISAEKLKSFDPLNYETYREHAQQSITHKIQQAIPSDLGYSFRFSSLDGDRTKLVVQIVDAHKGFTPVGDRGAGVQQLITFLGMLTTADLEKGHHLILFDEPENSLHADAQRVLRRLLESVAQRPNVQVIYATHSPVMINPLYPGRIRVLRRESSEAGPATRVDEPASNDNYQIVRTTLGMLPSDSLLYADVAVVVEGDSEARSLPKVLLKCHQATIKGFESVPEVLANIHFVNGGGDSFDKLCRIAISQGSTPVIFLDGDKQKRQRQLGKIEVLADVPIVSLAEGYELEDVVPKEKYFEAIAEVHDLDGTNVNEQRFTEWAANGQPDYFKRKLFSKQVEDWLEAEFDLRRFMKARTIETAIEETDVSDLKELHVFQQLCREINNLLS